MEYNFSEIIEAKLKEIYNLDEETSYIYKYVTIRAAVFYNQRKVPKQKLFDFILDEINISSPGTNLSYNGENYKKLDIMMELFEHFDFRAEIEGMELKETLEFVFAKGYQRAQKYKKDASYSKHLALEGLNVLNREMGVNPIPSEGTEGFELGPTHNPFKRTLEEQLVSEIEANKVSYSTSKISEKELEDYLIEKLDLIEKGLRPIQRQYEVKGGTIDILARDKDNELCVIELKISEDKSLVWQTIHYTAEVKREFNTNKVRMITVAPSYSSPIRNALKAHGNVEMFEYIIKVEGKDIVEFECKEVE